MSDQLAGQLDSEQSLKRAMQDHQLEQQASIPSQLEDQSAPMEERNHGTIGDGTALSDEPAPKRVKIGDYRDLKANGYTEEPTMKRAKVEDSNRLKEGMPEEKKVDSRDKVKGVALIKSE